MNSSEFTCIRKAQKEYQDIIRNYEELFQRSEIPLNEIGFFLDEIQCFWLKRIDIITFELDELVERQDCFLLCGAVYLNVSDCEHYYFKSMGKCHLLFDPFIKLEEVVRISESKADSSSIVNYYKKIYYDTVKILNDYQNYFYILPLRELSMENRDSQLDLLNKFFLKFLSGIFKMDIASKKEFDKNFNTFEEIEKALDPYTRKHLIFTDVDDSKISLREKIDRYSKVQMDFLEITKGCSESQIFYVATYSWVSQVVDILLRCVYLGVNPYIRFEVTFHYFALIMHTFIGDEYLRNIIEKSIIFYIFRKSVSVERLNKIEFSEYCSILKHKDILKDVQEKIKKQKINIFKGGVKRIANIINDELVQCLGES